MIAATPVSLEAVANLNDEVIGRAPSLAMGNLYVATSHAMALSAENTAFMMAQNKITASAVTSAGAAIILAAVASAII
ncbi:RebB family R body protein [Sulfidibacter corallicola]|uniref:RebB family R body protein n=1 Tax=Sulfidibacter corallicola TaxID=2818388 RepID=A0A8A4TKS1_SULCO|nr:RebB family R body protein [Sulfidibacter corallicola]QTD49438.1 RebB family R body protein [Sulfidibacter corallicola]